MNNHPNHNNMNASTNASSYDYTTTNTANTTTTNNSDNNHMLTNNHNTADDPNSSSSSIAQRIKNFDFQNNIPSEFRVYTTHGAFLSFTTILLLFYLLTTEYTYNLSTITTKESVYVNTASNQLIELEIDITFSDIACPLLSFDAFDPNKQRQTLHLDRHHRVYKHRIGLDGKMIGRKSKFEQGMSLQNEEHVKEYANQKQMKFKIDLEKSDEVNDDDGDNCGSCYGAGEEGECCNTCEDVKRVYQRKGWSFTPNLDVKQCHDMENSNSMVGEGCNIHGMVALSSGGGHLHITPGHELENFGKKFAFQDLNDLINQAYDTFNVTHKVNKLRFGKEYPGDIHQLDDERRMVNDTSAMYQYYFQIVPTEFRFLNGTTIQTNQFSVIEHMRHVQAGRDRGLPGVYFYYELSPLHVRIEEDRHGWIRFLTSVAAVVGGVFSAMKMMDAYIFSQSSTNKGMMSHY